MSKQPIILVNRHGRPSMMSVYKAIGGDLKYFVKSSRFNGMVERHKGVRRKLRGVEKPDARGAILIRWGSRQEAITDEHSVVYNKNEDVAKTNSKGLCRKILREAGIPIPTTYLRNEDMTNIVFPAIGRPEHHGRGSSFFVCNNHVDIENAKRRGCTYFSTVYPKKNEYRFHCAHGKILAVMEKSKPKNPDQLAWNRSLGTEPFVVVNREDWDIDLCKLALDACETMNLSFSAIDVLAYAGEGYPKGVICELNCAGTINSSPYVHDKYVKFFKWLFASDKRRPKWNYKGFKKATSLSWKEEQLLPSFEIPEENCL